VDDLSCCSEADLSFRDSFIVLRAFGTFMYASYWSECLEYLFSEVLTLLITILYAG
jgi:hypothetical protein